MSAERKYEFSRDNIAGDDDEPPGDGPPPIVKSTIGWKRQLAIYANEFWFRRTRRYYYHRAQWSVRYYPVYRPPHLKSEETLTRAQAQDNFDYFMSVKDQRIEGLRQFVSRFGVKLSFDEHGFQQMSDWFDRWAPFFVRWPREPKFPYRRSREFWYPSAWARTTILECFLNYGPGWDTTYRGLNVLFDFGIYIGEYLVHTRRGFHWEICSYSVPGEGNIADYQKAWITNPGLSRNEGELIFFWVLNNADWNGAWFGMPCMQAGSIRIIVNSAIEHLEFHERENDNLRIARPPKVYSARGPKRSKMPFE